MPLRGNSPCVVRAGLNIRGCGPLSTLGFFDRLRGGFRPPLNYLPSAVSFFPSLSFTSAPFSASGMGRPMRPAFSSMESPSLAM